MLVPTPAPVAASGDTSTSGGQPATPVSAPSGQVPDSSVTPESAGQSPVPPQSASDGSAAPAQNLLEEIARKKGWDPEKASELLAQSYSELETKLGSYSEIERKAQRADELNTELEAARKKAEAWDAAQKYLDSVDKDGKPDLSRMEIKDLATLWQEGQIGLADVPPNLQFQVQQFVTASQSATERQLQGEAQSLVERYPILNDPYVAEFVATKIEAGADPHQAVKLAQQMLNNAEKRVEERHKRDTEAIKNGNLETTGSPVATKPNVKITSVADAFRAAKAELNMK